MINALLQIAVHIIGHSGKFSWGPIFADGLSQSFRGLFSRMRVITPIIYTVLSYGSNYRG
jgi:hypothetical protein